MSAPIACPERPRDFPFRCGPCPVMAWPRATGPEYRAAAALKRFAETARCPHDFDPIKNPDWHADMIKSWGDDW